MEHRVKQRSAEWFKLRRSVMLTASQFADVVGVGKGKPFHFFQSCMEKEGEDIPSSCDTQNLKHGERMEIVIKEAYELLTGLRVLESGFWVPGEGHSMVDLIGASPDGMVVSDKDTSIVLGLVEFKAPIHKMYDQIPGTQNGIPRHCMVQIQGQMAVCGAPWCDFMAVCSKTQDIMLKRVYFQPRYWEHIARCLRQFCFALQEAEIMQELGRDIYSGAMTQHIKKLGLHDKPFPAEDTIIVENLLIQSQLQLFRGPSQKLLSYEILVGDTYILPPTLSQYGQDLLAKVDAEIQGRVPGLEKGQVLVIEQEELGRVCHRQFSKEANESKTDLQENVSKDRSGGKENNILSANDGVSVGNSLTSNASSVPQKELPVKSGTGPQSTSNVSQVSQSRPKPLISVPATPVVLSSSSTKQPDSSRMQSPPFRKLSRNSAGTQAAGRPLGMSVQSKPQVNVSKPIVPNSSPRAAALTKTPKTSVPGNVMRPGILGSSPRAVVSGSRTAGPKPSPKSPVPLRARVPGSSPRGAVPQSSPRMAAPKNSQTASSVPPQSPTGAVTTFAAVSSNTTRVSSATKNTVASSTAVSTTAVSTASAAPLTTRPQTSSTQPKVVVVSARDEWEMAAKKKLTVSKGQNSPVVKTAVIEPTSTAQTPPGTSQGANKPVSSSTGSVTMSVNVNCRGDGGKTETSVEDNMKWRSKVLSSSSSFVPPGLTLLSSPHSSHGDMDTTSKAGTETAAQKSPTAPEGVDVGDKKDITDKLDKNITDKPESAQQARKRPSSSVPDVENKKPLLDRVLQGDEGEIHRSPERFPIHRPWQSHEEGREHIPDSDRHAPRFGRDQSVHSFDQNRDERQGRRGRGDGADMSRDRPHDMPHQRQQPTEESRGARIQSLLDRGREEASRVFEYDRGREEAHSRVFDYDLTSRVASDDFHRNRGQHNLRTNPASTAVQFDNLRHLPLDLSERGRLQERDMLMTHRGPMLGREGLDRGGLDSSVWRGPFQRQMQQQQSVWQPHQHRPDLPSLRNPLHSNWPRGLGVRTDTHRALDLQLPPHLDRRFPDLEGRDPRMGGPNMDFRGNMIRSQFPRNFPRRPYDY